VLLGVGFAVTLVLILLLLLFYQVGLANLVPPTVVTVIDLLATVGINLFLLLAPVGAALGRAPVAEEVS